LYDRLEQALEEARPGIELALQEARDELTLCEERCRNLRRLISRAEAVVGTAREDDDAITRLERGLTLHDAMAEVLADLGPDGWTTGMTARELADAINDAGLYRMRDGSPVEVSQIHARAKNYREMFEKDGPRIRLRGQG
jgi:hypothetical protein